MHIFAAQIRPIRIGQPGDRSNAVPFNLLKGHSVITAFTEYHRKIQPWLGYKNVRKRKLDERRIEKEGSVCVQ